MLSKLTSISLLVLPLFVAGFGDVGHRTVAYVAEKVLTNETDAYLKDILANNFGYDFGDAANWPDHIKYRMPWTKEWHYIDAHDTPPVQCSITFARDCLNEEHQGGCIASAFINQTNIFISPQSTALQRKESLMFLMHFVGDIHQPLHTENAYRGGNGIPTCFHKACTGIELHGVWDSLLIHELLGIPHHVQHDVGKVAAATWSSLLFEANKDKAESQCADVYNPVSCIMAWAEESNSYVCSNVFRVGGLTDIEEIKRWFYARDLGGEYYEDNIPVLSHLVGIGGIRLGVYLNALVTAAKAAESQSQPQLEL